MAFKIPVRCGETTTTTGTGTVTTAGAPLQMQTFNAGVGTTNTCPYMIVSGDNVNWERGIGTVTVAAGVTTVARTTVVESSNSNAAISLVGTSFIFVALPGDIANANGLLDEVFTTVDGTYSLKRLSGVWTLTTSASATSGLTLISTQTASSSAFIGWTALGSLYETYLLVVHNLVPATDGSSFLVQVGEGAGPTWKTTGYASSCSILNSTGGSNGPTNSTAGIILSTLGISNVTANGGQNASVWCGNIPNSAQCQFHGTCAGAYNVTPTIFSGNTIIGTYNADTTAKTAIRVIATAGNIASGKATLYGLTEA